MVSECPRKCYFKNLRGRNRFEKYRKKRISKENAINYEKEQKELEIKKKLNEKHNRDMFSGFVNLLGLLKSFNNSKTLSHVEKMELLNYLIFTKKVIFKKNDMNIILSEKINARISMLQKFLTRDENTLCKAIECVRF